MISRTPPINIPARRNSREQMNVRRNSPASFCNSLGEACRARIEAQGRSWSSAPASVGEIRNRSRGNSSISSNSAASQEEKCNVWGLGTVREPIFEDSDSEDPNVETTIEVIETVKQRLCTGEIQEKTTTFRKVRRVASAVAQPPPIVQQPRASSIPILIRRTSVSQMHDPLALPRLGRPGQTPRQEPNLSGES